MQVDIHHLGVWSFKGLLEPTTVVQIGWTKLARRQYPATQLSRKAKMVGASQGLICTVRLQ